MGKDLLKTYYNGVLQRLRAEVDFMNGVFEHQGLKGEGNEAVLRDLIRKFLPGQYGVGTGVVIDRNGHVSRQCDIVVFDRLLYPTLLSLGNVHLYPVDMVYAVIEVKTTLTATEAAKAIENIKSVRTLDIVDAPFVVWGNNSVSKYVPTPPMGFVFSYNSEAAKFSTFHEWFVPSERSDRRYYPSMVGSLDQGVVRFVDVEQTEASIVMGVACVLTSDGGEMQTNVTTVVHAGIQCPIKEVQGNRVAIDQSKALLMFLLLLTETLARKHINPDLRFSDHYLHGALRYTMTEVR